MKWYLEVNPGVLKQSNHQTLLSLLKKVPRKRTSQNVSIDRGSAFIPLLICVD